MDRPEAGDVRPTPVLRKGLEGVGDDSDPPFANSGSRKRTELYPMFERDRMRRVDGPKVGTIPR